jgi:hypothetical protein
LSVCGGRAVGTLHGGSRGLIGLGLRLLCRGAGPDMSAMVGHLLLLLMMLPLCWGARDGRGVCLRLGLLG